MSASATAAAAAAAIMNRRVWLKSPGEPPATIAIRAGTEPAVIAVADGAVSLLLGEEPDPDASLAGPPQLVLAVLSGRMSPAAAAEQGLRCAGSTAVLARVLPSGGPPSGAAEAGVVADLAAGDRGQDR